MSEEEEVVLEEVEEVVEPKEKPKSSGKKVAVKVVAVKGLGALVEYVEKDMVRRTTVPTEAYDKGKVAQSDLDAGVPYGLPWEDVEFPAVTGVQLANALRNAGIWTADDLRKNPNLAVNALQSIYRVDLGALLKFAKSQEV